MASSILKKAMYGGPGGVVADLAVDTDDLEFSENDGGDFDYTPLDDGTGCDEDITDFRVRPGDALAAGASFTLTFRYEIK